MKLTAATITDEQIHELRRAQSPATENCARLCSIALGEDDYYGDLISPEGIAARIKNARARCAELLNARSLT